MSLTQSQIAEFTKRARIAGLNDGQIQEEIAKKVSEFDQSNGLSQPATVTKPNSVMGTSPSSKGIDTTVTQEEGFISKFVKGVIQPAVDYGKFVGEAAYQGSKYVFDPTFRKLVNGEKLTPEELATVNTDTAFYGKDEAQKKLGTRKDIAITGAKAGAGMESYFIPFGKGANIATKALIPGFASGALAEVSKEDTTATSVLESGVMGGATAGVLDAVGGMISWARGKGDDLVRQSETLDDATRKINVKASIFGASKEKVINQTLDKYGFKGTAQSQYEMLEPTMKKIEGEIQGIIKADPNLSVAKKDIKTAFLTNLKSSLRTKDLTKQEAISEVDGYVTDLLKASGGTGKFTNITIGKLRDMKKVLNDDYGAVFKKVIAGNPLTSREKVIEAAWSSLDDAVTTASPAMKALLTEESHLYQATQSLSSARYNPPTFRVAGTSIPAGVTQRLRDIGSDTLKKIGVNLEKLPENNIFDQELVQRIASLTPSALKENGLSDEEITKVEDLQNSLKTTAPSASDNITKTSPDLNTKPNPQNPFGGLSKRQVLSLALTQGATSSDLTEVGKLYDMLAADPTVIDADAQKAADGLRTEYFKRTSENGFVGVLSSYQKIQSTSDTPQGDISLIYAFMKMLDPTSVVREGEFATAEQTAGIPQQIINQYNKALKGSRLSSEQRRGYISEASRVFQTYQERQAPIDAYYQGLAQRYGIDPSLVGIGLYSSGQ